jgi:hypothetical protein
MAKILLVKVDWRFAEGSVRRNGETMYPGCRWRKSRACSGYVSSYSRRDMIKLLKKQAEPGVFAYFSEKEA